MRERARRDIEDARMFAYFLRRGIPHTVLEALSPNEREFYIAVCEG